MLTLFFQRNLQMNLQDFLMVVNFMALEPHFSLAKIDLETSSESATEVSTTDALVAVGLGSQATCKLYEAGARSKGCVATFTLPNQSGAVESCCWVVNGGTVNSTKTVSVSGESIGDDDSGHAFSEYGFLSGGQNGEFAAWDIRHSSRPLIQLTGKFCCYLVK